MTGCVVSGRETGRLYACSEGGRLVCDLCHVETADMYTDCEETWEQTLSEQECKNR
jgi:hypothetical protein